MNKAENGVSGQNLQALLQHGLQAHQDGRLADAEAAYRRVLGIDADNADANHLLGLIARQAGNNETAVELISKAIRTNPDEATYHNNLGNALKDLERSDDAVESYRAALAVQPDFAAAHSNLGAALKELGRLEEAAASIRKAIDLQPDLASAHVNLGNALKELGRMDDAVDSYRKGLTLNPNAAKAHSNLGLALQQLGRLEEAADCHDKAVALAPDDAEAHGSLGLVLHEMDRLDDAMASYDRAISLNPDYAEAMSNRGNTLQELGRLDEAIACYREAIALKPEYSEAHSNLGHLQLLMGDYRNGWEECNWRWRVEEFNSPRRFYDKPLWDGSPIGGKRLLVWSEQGIGDEILHASMIPDLIGRGINVILESDARLVPLFVRSFSPITCIAKGDANQAFDFHIPSGGLGQVLRPSLGSFPKPAPYLIPDPDLRNQIRDRYLTPAQEPLVGIAWRSSSCAGREKSSLSLSSLRPLLEIPGITFVDLQYGDTDEELASIKEETGTVIVHDNEIDQFADLDAFAAQVAAMDIVVSIENSTAVIAGAMGIPTRVMLCAVPFWFWGMDREDSPWFPGMRLLRQHNRGEWLSVIKDAARELANYKSPEA